MPGPFVLALLAFWKGLLGGFQIMVFHHPMVFFKKNVTL